MGADDPPNPYAAPRAAPDPAGRPRGPRNATSAAEWGLVAFIVTGLSAVLFAAVQNARARHGSPPFLPGWLLRLLDRNGDGVLNVHDDPLFVAAALLLPPLAALAAAGGFRLVRALLARPRRGGTR